MWLVLGSFCRNVLKWSALRKSFGDVRFFEEKGHSLSVAPEPLAIWDKNLEDLEFGLLEELKTWSVVAPEHTSGSFYLERTRIQGLGVFSGSLLLSDVVVRWWLSVNTACSRVVQCWHILPHMLVLEYLFLYA